MHVSASRSAKASDQFIGFEVKTDDLQIPSLKISKFIKFNNDYILNMSLVDIDHS